KRAEHDRREDQRHDQLRPALQELEEEEEVPVGPRDRRGARVGRRLELQVLLHERGQQPDRDEHHHRDDRVRPEVVREERVRLVIRHVVGQVVARRAHQDGEQGKPDQHRVEDVVRPDRKALPLGLEGVTAVPVHLDERDLVRRRDRGRRAGSVLLYELVHHMGSEMPCARMKRKCTYMSRVIKSGSTKTWMVKKRCSVGGPTTGPPWSTSLMKAPSCAGGAEPAILIVTSVAKYALVSQGSRYPVSEKARMISSIRTPTIQFSSRGARYEPVQ